MNGETCPYCDLRSLLSKADGSFFVLDVFEELCDGRGFFFHFATLTVLEGPFGRPTGIICLGMIIFSMLGIITMVGIVL